MPVREFQLDPCQSSMNIVYFVIDCTKPVSLVTCKLSQLLLLWTNEFPIITLFTKFYCLVCLRFKLDHKSSYLYLVKVQVSVRILIDLGQKIENLVLISKKRKHNCRSMETFEAWERNLNLSILERFFFAFLFRQYCSQLCLSLNLLLYFFLLKLLAVLFLLLQSKTFLFC